MPGRTIVANQLSSYSKPCVGFEPIVAILIDIFRPAEQLLRLIVKRRERTGQRASPMFPIQMGWALRWQERSAFFVVSARYRPDLPKLSKR